MRMKRDKDRLVLRSENAQGRGGAVAIGMGVASLLLREKLSSPEAGGLNVGHLVGAVFIVAGIGFSLPRRIITIFDLSSRQVCRTITIWKARWPRTRTVPFSEILSVGYDRPNSDDQIYWPALRLANGATLWISLNPSHDMDMSELDVIAEATGLRIRNAA